MKELENVITKKSKSPANFIDFTNRKIGLCTVLNRVDHQSWVPHYLVECECGNRFISETSNLRRAKFEKCRCGFKNHILKHTLRKMIDRCNNLNNLDYKYYGKKGITVFQEWKKFPIKFVQWSLRNGWEKGLTIDRIDSSQGYHPDNCRFISRQENAKIAQDLRWRKNKIV